jgi:hypothetical protein
MHETCKIAVSDCYTPKTGPCHLCHFLEAEIIVAVAGLPQSCQLKRDRRRL